LGHLLNEFSKLAQLNEEGSLNWVLSLVGGPLHMWESHYMVFFTSPPINPLECAWEPKYWKNIQYVHPNKIYINKEIISIV
jgi:hypothetical protein